MLGAGAAFGAIAATLVTSAAGGAVAGGVVSKIKYLFILIINLIEGNNVCLPIGVGVWDGATGAACSLAATDGTGTTGGTMGGATNGAPFGGALVAICGGNG